MKNFSNPAGHIHDYHGHRYNTPSTGIGNGIFRGTLLVTLVTEPSPVKHPYTRRYQAKSPYTTMADKETTSQSRPLKA